MGKLTVAQAECLLIRPGEVDRSLLREALLVAVHPAEYRMLGICAETAEEAVAALQGYLNAFGEPLPVVDVPQGIGLGVFIKYNGRTASCTLTSYTGSERGAIVSCYSPGNAAYNETYAGLPLDLFATTESGSSKASNPMSEAERASFGAPSALRRASQEFLDLDFEERQRVLRSLGLGRYGILLGRLQASESNLIVVMGFLGQPGRVKFPNLRGADLAGLVLDGVNLIRADLSRANLSGCRLHRADLLFAQFTDADVRGADLTGATLHETLWDGARVEGCRFGTGYGLRADQRHILLDRGGLFSNPMGDNG